MTRRLFPLLLVVLALALAVAACGGDDDDTTAEAAAEDTTDPRGRRWRAPTSPSRPTRAERSRSTQTELTAAAGEVTIELVNESGNPHNVEVEGNGVEEVSETISEGIDELDVDPRAGRVRVLLRHPGPPRGRHGGNADGRVRRVD